MNMGSPRRPARPSDAAARGPRPTLGAMLPDFGGARKPGAQGRSKFLEQPLPARRASC